MREIEQMIMESSANCTGCYACYNVCQMQAIEMVEDEEGFRYPVIDNEKCINCGACYKTCPRFNLSVEGKTDVPDTYAVINENDTIRLSSSSGGVFHLLAQKVIEDGGIVFGAAFDENWEVAHSSAETEADLSRLRVSKYLQSRAENVYREVKRELDKGRKVLFAGTPCQGAALHSFLKIDYSNLLIVDFICHGVPSPAVWRRYVKWRTKGKEINHISFRNKNLSWEKYLLVFSLKNTNKHLSKDLHHDLYMKGFLQNLYLRPSCHECHFCKKNRLVDITLGDYWGVKVDLPEAYDGKGTSLVFIHSKHGRTFFSQVEARKWRVDFYTAVSHNASMLHSSVPSVHRKEFFSEFTRQEKDIGYMLNKYTKLGFKASLHMHINDVKRILLKIPGVRALSQITRKAGLRK